MCHISAIRGSPLSVLRRTVKHCIDLFDNDHYLSHDCTGRSTCLLLYALSVILANVVREKDGGRGYCGGWVLLLHVAGGEILKAI